MSAVPDRWAAYRHWMELDGLATDCERSIGFILRLGVDRSAPLAPNGISHVLQIVTVHWEPPPVADQLVRADRPTRSRRRGNRLRVDLSPPQRVKQGVTGMRAGQVPSTAIMG